VKSKAAWLLTGLLAFATVQARADWLVTREGGRLEIKGTWKEKGKLVIFTLPDGTLSSMRTEQVDLEASRAATADAVAEAERKATEAAQEAVEKPRKKSIISLTDKDFKKAAPPEEEAGADGKDKADPAKTSSPSANGVQVVNWERVPNEKVTSDGLELTGSLRNGGEEQATDIQVMANLYDEVGTLVGKVPAQLSKPTLGPGESTPFSIAAPGLYSFSAVRFDVQSRGFKANKPAAAGTATAPSNPPG
jgi:hypothetical protein